MSVTNIAEELKARGFIENEGGGKMDDFLSEKRIVYLGMDPTADSLHVGNLVPILLMKRLADAGHEVYFLIGGGTGMIGDPRESGERVLLDEKTVAENTEALRTQLLSIFGEKKYGMLNNADWLSKLGVIEFLRDTGKHFTVNQLVKRDLIKKRLESEDPISFTEFSYSLLQGYDFLHLYKEYGVDLQVGGSDQWANVISGVDLIRRKEQGDAYALTVPIVVDVKTGKKFGKSEGNAVWLDPKKTSPFAFYQFWFNLPDDGLELYMRIFTDIPTSEINSIIEAHEKDPALRVAQRRLAQEVTTLIHGAATAEQAVRLSEILYSKDDRRDELTSTDIEELKKNMHVVEYDPDIPVKDMLSLLKLVPSASEMRRAITAGSVSCEGEKITDIHAPLDVEMFKNGIARIRVGKKIGIIWK